MIKNLAIKINQAPLLETVLDDLVELTVDSDYFLPGMFSFTLLDSFDSKTQKMRYSDDTTRFSLGAAVEITFPAEGQVPTPLSLIKGEITNLEPVFTAGQALLRVRGYEPSHRMTRGQQTRAFGNGNSPMMLKDILTSVISAHLTPMIDATAVAGISYPYLLQYNQTDWEFLEGHARMLGCQMYVKDNIFHFEKIGKPRILAPVLLDWGKDLSRFEPRLSLMGQVTQSQVLGWDPDLKRSLQAQMNMPTASMKPSINAVVTQGGSAGAAHQKTFGAAIAVETTEGVSIPQMQAMADGALVARENNFVRGEGFCDKGNPKIQAGCQVQIANIGLQFSGTYLVTKALHQWREGNYTVAFSVAGSSSNSIYSLLRPKAEPVEGRIYGMVPAVVTDNNDPEQLGRVKVTFPWMPKANNAPFTSGWVRNVSPAGGAQSGISFMPEVQEEVLVAFEQGNPNFGYLVGRLWSKQVKPPVLPGAIQGGKVYKRCIRTAAGLTLLFDDTSGQQQIVLQDSKGKNSIILDATKGTITLKSKQDLILDAGGSVSIKSKMDITAECNGSLKLSAQKEASLKTAANHVDLKTAGVDIGGPKVDLKGLTTASLSASTLLEIKGNPVAIN